MTELSNLESTRKQFEKWCTDARSYFDSGQYDLAKAAVDRALSYYDVSSDNDAFFSLAADVYKMNQKYPEALDYICKAIVINPQNAMYYILKARIYREYASTFFRDSEIHKREQFIENARDSLNQAVTIAHRNNDKTSESAAYGLLAYYHYFVPYPDIAKSEEYAKKSIDMGDVWGNAGSVLNDIKTKRQQKAKAAEEKAKKEREEKEQWEKHVRENKRQEGVRKRLKALYTICWFAFFGWFAFVVYSMCRFKDVYGFFTIVLLIIISAWIMLGRAVEGYSPYPKVISFVFYVGYLIGAGIIKSNQWGHGMPQTIRAWKFVGVNIIVLIAVMVVFNLIGKAIADKT